MKPLSEKDLSTHSRYSSEFSSFESSKFKQPKNKIIWMCWFQGLQHFRKKRNHLNGACIQKWKELNPDWEVNVLDNDTINEYVPEYWSIVKKATDLNRSRGAPAKSDLLRILLLSKFGGVWVDASVYPMEPLSNFYDKLVNETGFFAYRFFPRSWGKGANRGACARETVSWFMCAQEPQNYLIEEWKHLFINRFIKRRGWPYFHFHSTLCYLYDRDEKIRHIIDNMVQIDEKIPHSACRGNWETKKPSFVYKRPKKPKDPKERSLYFPPFAL